ncbi:S8 family serine peptidase [Hymenobacter properus]|uniref:S8 family serine peptidase n=1 Tax=Hymenobacter properus TaxID=2791026 RepID=A0A931BIN8_9BACT|nr:S8 family serine peptidase [Hymenobacter properus]MBF9142072.1 S8 family serine peptidase [Hymenobacter properus]MBR7720879.1 S8 family serine peptidase [Microvirga sp. SRT04]
MSFPTRSSFSHLALLGLLSLVTFNSHAQTAPAAEPTPAQIRRWQHLDLQADGVPGISADKAYRELLGSRVPTPVLVAVIDSGIDTAHVDLKPVLWRNPKEVAGNGLDDDQNGYADDLRGWSFLGGPDGRNIAVETLEQTRIYAQYRSQFEGKTRQAVPKADRAKFDLYEQAKASYEKGKKDEERRLARYTEALTDNTATFERLKQALGVSRLDSALVHEAATRQPAVPEAGPVYAFMRRAGLASDEDALKALNAAIKRSRNRVEMSFNPDYNPRAIVGDNLQDLRQSHYGNADIQGPDATHGTHCAGIIGGLRGNGLGADGVAGDMVRIMGVRSTPSGDERDKDVANAIRYAVDNGAQVISMSFGKEFSPDKAVVDEAMKYAAQKNVLLVHAAGNSGLDVDKTPEYPSARSLNGKLIPNLLTVGASSRLNTSALAASFSNYGKQTVDVFAPGVDIYSSTPANTYASLSGTSMAAPVVAGVAAVLKSYFPQLTAVQLKQIIEQSATPYHTQVLRPGAKDMVDFATLSKSSGIVNLYEAVKLADKMTMVK